MGTHQHTTKLLIVDDLPENLLALTKIIEQDDRRIYQAQSGEQALALLLEHDFALAIIDVMMPGMDGFELAELMRGAGAHAQCADRVRERGLKGTQSRLQGL
ncbi:response regulator [Massilia sp. B-10]|nr:response regulator [Massilia sp. B-10]